MTRANQSKINPVASPWPVLAQIDRTQGGADATPIVAGTSLSLAPTDTAWWRGAMKATPLYFFGSQWPHAWKRLAYKRLNIQKRAGVCMHPNACTTMGIAKPNHGSLRVVLRISIPYIAPNCHVTFAPQPMCFFHWASRASTACLAFCRNDAKARLARSAPPDNRPRRRS